MCGALSMSARASFSMEPHSGVGGCVPRPRKDRLAAVMIEVPMRIVRYTTIDEIVPGSRWRSMMTESGAPMERTASI